MMQYHKISHNVRISDEEMARLACNSSRLGQDSRSGYKVGSSVQVEIDMNAGPKKLDTIYRANTAFNMNISGMQTKRHAEQRATIDAIQYILENKDGYAIDSLSESTQLKQVVVHTQANDGAVKCGHCIQTINGLCDEYGWDKSEVDYIGVSHPHDSVEGMKANEIDWTFERYSLRGLMGSTYVEK